MQTQELRVASKKKVSELNAFLLANFGLDLVVVAIIMNGG
jgi:hypothetical protein